jgi:hypothetical protein
MLGPSVLAALVVNLAEHASIATFEKREQIDPPRIR